MSLECTRGSGGGSGGCNAGEDENSPYLHDCIVECTAIEGGDGVEVVDCDAMINI